MKFLLFLLFASSLFGETIDPNTTDFSFETKPKVHVDAFEFPGLYSELKNIAIDATRKMRVEVDLSGEYPQLEKVNYIGSFGTLKGEFTGKFTTLSTIDITTSSTDMQLDLRGNWEKSCTFNITGGRGSVELILPKNISLIIHTRVGIKGRVINQSLEKMGHGIFKKDYTNGITSKNALTLNIQVSEGKIILK